MGELQCKRFTLQLFRMSDNKKSLEKSRLFSSGREIRTLDTTGMNRVLWPTELFRHDDGAYRARTCDPLLVRQMLSQLS